MKYFPDKFYIETGNFDAENNLTKFLHDLNIQQDQAIYIHEYYHYLTNLTTYSGIRQFVHNFVHKHLLTVKLASAAGLDAFPINGNTDPSLDELINEWNFLTELCNEDDLDMNFARACLQPLSNFHIDKILWTEHTIRGKNGYPTRSHRRISVCVSGNVGRDSFVLTSGAIDEFLSSAIDEYLFENGYSEIDARVLQDRPQYPYRTFDLILRHYGFRANSAEKIMLAYFSLHSEDPAYYLIDILEELKVVGFEAFQKDPENFLRVRVKVTRVDSLLSKISEYADARYDDGAIHISQALKYYCDKFYAAQKFLELDFFYFVRPFFQVGDDLKIKQRFLLDLSRIINQFTPPVMLQDKSFKVVDKLTNFGECTLIILATYEIFESLSTNKFAERPNRYRDRYDFPGEPDCDNWRKLPPAPIPPSPYRLALNELGLYGLYLEKQSEY